jgi:hypothetical protein
VAITAAVEFLPSEIVVTVLPQQIETPLTEFFSQRWQFRDNQGIEPGQRSKIH